MAELSKIPLYILWIVDITEQIPVNRVTCTHYAKHTVRESIVSMHCRYIETIKLFQPADITPLLTDDIGNFTPGRGDCHSRSGHKAFNQKLQQVKPALPLSQLAEGRVIGSGKNCSAGGKLVGRLQSDPYDWYCGAVSIMQHDLAESDCIFER
jgi:hypothetical protein